MLSSFFERLYNAATELNRRNIVDLVSDREYQALCDLGCDDGDWTMNVAARSRASEIHGVEIVSERAQLAAKRGVRAQVPTWNHRSRLPMRASTLFMQTR